MSYRDGTRAGAVAAAVALAVGAAPVGAADWEMNPTLELGYLYDNNYRLTPPDLEDEVQGGVLDAQIEFRASGPLTQFSLVPRIRASYFPDDREDDSDDYFARMNWEHRTQVMRALVRADYSQESVISSEQPYSDIDSGLGETDGADAGIVVIQNRRDLARLQPSLSYDFSPAPPARSRRRRARCDFRAENSGHSDGLPRLWPQYRVRFHPLAAFGGDRACAGVALRHRHRGQQRRCLRSRGGMVDGRHGDGPGVLCAAAPSRRYSRTIS